MKKSSLRVTLLLWLTLWVGSAPVRAQIPREQPDLTVDGATRSGVIEELLKVMHEQYVFPEVATAVEKSLRKRIERKEYDAITSAAALATILTEHLQEVTHDKHLRVVYSHQPAPSNHERHQASAQERDRRRYFSSLNNFGFERLERLSGNIGYIDLRGFNPPEFGGETAAAAMNFLANTDALIIDLRKNGGGHPGMVALLCSYLFDAEPVHLNDLYWRRDNSTRQWWTLPYVPGKRYIDKDVYILTSKRTFSAAEEFTYNLKNLKRATVVGETTGGGAHPGGVERLDDHFSVFVPNGRAINPITKTNWEGKGVMPDIDVPAEQALKTAHVKALQKQLEKKTDERLQSQLRQVIENVQRELEALKRKP